MGGAEEEREREMESGSKGERRRGKGEIIAQFSSHTAAVLSGGAKATIWRL